MRRALAIILWKVGNKLAWLGCWIRGSHIDPADFPRKGYCQQCGLRKDIWQLPADLQEQEAKQS